jgi:hypothetical protein
MDADLKKATTLSWHLALSPIFFYLQYSAINPQIDFWKYYYKYSVPTRGILEGRTFDNQLPTENFRKMVNIISLTTQNAFGCKLVKTTYWLSTMGWSDS